MNTEEERVDRIVVVRLVNNNLRIQALYVLSAPGYILHPHSHQIKSHEYTAYKMPQIVLAESMTIVNTFKIWVKSTTCWFLVLIDIFLCIEIQSSLMIEFVISV